MRSLFGYADKISVRPGDRIGFKVSSLDEKPYRADIVRLICGDDSPDGPGFKEIAVDTDIGGEYPGRAQPVHAGSYARMPSMSGLAELRAFTLQAIVWPTTPAEGRQALIGSWCAESSAGFGLFIDGNGAAELRLGDGNGGVDSLTSGSAMVGREWYRIVAACDGNGHAWLRQEPLGWGLGIGGSVMVEKTAMIRPATDAAGAFMLAAHQMDDTGLVGGHFNGKIDRPRLMKRALDITEADLLNAETVPQELVADALGWWDLSENIGGTGVVDVSENQWHGETVNLPTRAVRGFNWSGDEHCWRHAPGMYGAIHFHDDDLYDAGWETDFTLTVPTDMQSGIFCARLIGESDEDRIPFFVRPPAGKPSSDVVVLMSTATYMAYGNIRWPMDSIFAEPKEGGVTVLTPDDVFLQENPEYGLSLYDKHADQTGVCHASRLRPIFNMRPKTGLWSLNADTHVTDWLEAIGQPYDVVTDEDLHQDGAVALDGYRVVVTGAHPEYWSTPMWDAMVGYQAAGGRLMYLGGNGFYWRIAYHETLPGVIELRRAEDGMRFQLTEPGEYYQSFNGELGGLWRRLGYPPNTLVGVGTVATGFDSASYYVRTPESGDPRAAFIFDGIGENENIGDFGLLLGGAAGVELDGVNRKLGTPPHALVVARSEGHSQLYYLCPEETPYHHPVMNGAENDRVRADMVFYETPAGGGVFSTGSISWCASLSHDGYDNNVARITENVLKRFRDPAPL